MARMAGYPTVTTSTFKDIFSYFGLQLPSEDQICSVTGERTIWYCNTGVVVFSASALREFFPSWRQSTIELLDNTELMCGVGVMGEQASFTIAHIRNPVPFTFLPLELNCPVPTGENVVDEVNHCDPTIIHYHSRHDPSGLIVPNKNIQAKRRIEEFNRRAAQERLPFVNQ